MKAKQYLLIFFFLSLIFFCSTKNTFSFLTSEQNLPNNTFTTASFFPTTTPDPKGIANHLVISEIQITGSNANQDFIELYNPTNESIELNGLSIVKRTASGTSDIPVAEWTSSSTVSAHGYYLLASDVDSSYPASTSADKTFSENLSNDNAIAIKDNASLIDSVGWGNASNIYVESNTFASNPTARHSLERKAYSTSTTSTMIGNDSTKGNAYDTDNNANDFVLRTVSQPQNSSSAIEIP